MTPSTPPVFDRTTQDVGNIVEFGHVNVRQPDQQLATLFYVTGLGLTRDPYMNTGVDNAWMNVGTCQFHLPTGPAQVLRGVTGLVMPDLDALERRLQRVQPLLAATQFSYARSVGAWGDQVAVTCPWGNRLRVHAPGVARFGKIRLGMPYVEIDCAPGTSPGIARFYREVLQAPAFSGGGDGNSGNGNHDGQGAFARIPIGYGESLVFRETTRTLPAYDGHHVQIAVADFSGVHRRLLALGLVTEESNDSQYRFQDIIDLDSRPQQPRVLATLEHEVRSMRHPMYARVLVNRRAANTADNYAQGHESEAWRMPPE